MSSLHLPDEIIINILSFINKKFINYRSNKKCICKTKSKSPCKNLTKNIFCHIHRNLDICSKLSLCQNIVIHKCMNCNGNCITKINHKWDFVCSQKCAIELNGKKLNTSHYGF